MKTYSLAQAEDKLLGKKGTPDRDKYEFDLQMELIGIAIKQTRKERNITQEELGEMIGVQKAQISRLESNAGNVTIDTLIRVFTALKAKVKFQIELPKANVRNKTGAIKYKTVHKLHKTESFSYVSEPKVGYKKRRSKK